MCYVHARVCVRACMRACELLNMHELYARMCVCVPVCVCVCVPVVCVCLWFVCVGGGVGVGGGVAGRDWSIRMLRSYQRSSTTAF